MASIESVRIVLMHSWSSCSSVRDGLSGALLMVSPGIGGCTIPLLASPQGGEWLSSTLPTYSQHRDPQKRGPYPGEPCPLELKHLRPGADEAPRPSPLPPPTTARGGRDPGLDRSMSCGVSLDKCRSERRRRPQCREQDLRAPGMRYDHRRQARGERDRVQMVSRRFLQSSVHIVGRPLPNPAILRALGESALKASFHVCVSGFGQGLQRKRRARPPGRIGRHPTGRVRVPMREASTTECCRRSKLR